MPALALRNICVQCPGRHLNGFADRPPVRPNISLGDTLAGLHAALGISMALLHRQTHNKQVPGQVGCLGFRATTEAKLACGRDLLVAVREAAAM